jgi:hypothetical protein
MAYFFESCGINYVKKIFLFVNNEARKKYSSMKIKIIRPLYWTIRKVLLNNLVIHRFWLSQQTLTSAEKPCPICSSANTRFLTFKFENQIIPKYLCMDCGHIFSSNLKKNLDQAKIIFNYQSENTQKPGQEFLLEKLYEVLSHAVKTNSYSILDFGVGGNLRASENLQVKYKNSQFLACDLYPLNKSLYFQSYADNSKLGIFDGIASNAVIEHMDNTLEAWTYLNHLLKPIKLGETYMIHAFPSLINEDPYHWTVKIKSHECLFSKTSLDLICKMTGFSLLKIKYFYQVQHPVFLFKKISDC